MLCGLSYVLRQFPTQSPEEVLSLAAWVDVQGQHDARLLYQHAPRDTQVILHLPGQPIAR